MILLLELAWLPEMSPKRQEASQAHGHLVYDIFAKSILGHIKVQAMKVH
jgi:hypothetical protein